MQTDQTYTYVASPDDERCRWWCLAIPSTINSPTERLPKDYIRSGSDLELPEGAMLIESEERHHRKQRGYLVRLLVVVRYDNGELGMYSLIPTIEIKSYIKRTDPDLMIGSGDVAGVIRMAIWLRRQPNLKEAALTLLEL